MSGKNTAARKTTRVNRQHSRGGIGRGRERKAVLKVDKDAVAIGSGSGGRAIRPAQHPGIVIIRQRGPGTHHRIGTDLCRDSVLTNQGGSSPVDPVGRSFRREVCRSVRAVTSSRKGSAGCGSIGQIEVSRRTYAGNGSGDSIGTSLAIGS